MRLTKAEQEEYYGKEKAPKAKTMEIDRDSIQAYGDFDDDFISEFISYCEMNGMPIPEIKKTPKGMALIGLTAENTETYGILLDTFMQDRKQESPVEDLSLGFVML